MCFRVQQYNSLYCSAQIKGTLKAKRICHVVQGDDELSSSVVYRDEEN